MVGSTLQAVALLLYLLYDGLYSLYVISAVFGLFQGVANAESSVASARPLKSDLP
jgi:hypothetical protein